MSKQYLEMKYHPAKKEVSFARFSEGTEAIIRNDSKLRKYMDERGKFVLQDHGNTFFEDITDAFDGEKSVHIKVVTPKNDYEDLSQMIEYYNESGNIVITAELLSELPDMEETYRVVREHGEKSVGILKKHQSQFFDIPLDNAKVKACAEMFSAAVQKEIESIASKIGSLSDNSVNLCFAGVYSSGKSALINAILGYKILPEDIKSETARMFKIKSPKQGEFVRIIFSIRHDYAELLWNDKNHVFEFGAAPTENNTRKTIQETLNSYKEEKQHRQIYEVLKILNSSDGINDIKVFFPIPLDNERVQFTIYDTPGTDSNYGDHEQILLDALSEQTHSILVFVAAPDRIEGEGNNALLLNLKKAEKKDSKTTIDIGRSLFIINKADTIDPDARKVLQTAKITDKIDDSFSIKLSNKKLFFVSALYAYSAKAVANNIATRDEQYRIEDDYNKIFRPERGRYYLQNRVATSEYATDLQISRSNDVLSNREQKKDRTGVFVVCSGLFALESEIAAYGEKYAAAVRAFAIIDSVDKALSTMNNKAKSLEQQTLENINEINNEIEELRKTIFDGIKAAYEKYEYPKGKPLPSNVLKTLQLNKEYLQSNINGNILSFIGNKLKGWFFGLGKVLVNDKLKKELTQKITSVLSDFTNEFLSYRQLLLEQLRDNFLADIKKTVHDNGNISDKAKNFVLDIPPPQISEFTYSEEFSDLFSARKRVEKFLWFDVPYLDKDGYIEDVDRKLTKMTTEMTTDYEKDFRDTLMRVLSKIETDFTQNINDYSMLMQAYIANKKDMEQLGEKIAGAARDLMSCQEELNKVIWSVKDDR